MFYLVFACAEGNKGVILLRILNVYKRKSRQRLEGFNRHLCVVTIVKPFVRKKADTSFTKRAH